MKNHEGIRTLVHFFDQCVVRFQDNIFLWENRGDGYTGATYIFIQQQVTSMAAGLLSIGIRKGDRIALLSEARNGWVISELAILFCGAVNVPLSVRMNEPEEIRFRLFHSGARMIFVSGNHLKKIRDLRSLLPGLETVIVFDSADNLQPGEISVEQLIKTGERFLHESASLLDERKKSVQPGDFANISYTSGTTSDPKGIILTHDNYLTNVEQAYSLMDISEDFVTLLILPWDHAFAHTAGIYCFMGKGASIASVQAGKTSLETLKNLSKNIREIRPRLLYTVPAIANNFRKNIEKTIESRGFLVRWIFNTGLKTSYLYNGFGYNKGKGWKILLKPFMRLFDHLIFRKVREAFGGRLEFFIGGGALLEIEVQRFFYAIGIPMLQGYGLTEASPLISANSLHDHKLGSSGKVVDGLDLKICDVDGNPLPEESSGEIVIRGGNVMAGYWQNGEATAAVLKDGWLHTGDLGYLDRDGYLYLLGRFKSLLIANDGEKYSPEGMEETMMAQSVFIDQCMLYNNQDPYTVLLVFPNRKKILHYLSGKHLDPMTENGLRMALGKIEREVMEYRTGRKFGGMFPQRWLPAAIAVLDEGFTEENHLLNFQLKTVRGKVVEKYSNRIRHLFTPSGKSLFNDQNLTSLKRLLSA